MKATDKKKPVKSKTVEQGAIIEQGNELGNVQIHDNVISIIVRKTVAETEGVSRLAGNIVDSIGELVGSRRKSSSAITIIHEDDKVKIEVKVNILFGFKIPDVSKAIQKEVIQEVENITGINVASVGVIIQEIEEPVPVKEVPQPEEDIITE
jgi:uncharacterized alkaline shock family protein YloU